MFPGIVQDPQKINLPFSRMYSGDAKLRHLMSPFRRSRERPSTDEWSAHSSSLEHNTNESTRSAPSDSMGTEDDSSAPASSDLKADQMATHLEHTFGHAKLKALQ